MKKILLAKPWQVFFLVVGIQFIYRIFMLFGDYDDLLVYTKYMPIIVVVSAIGFFSWLWCVVINLHNRIPNDITIEINYFKFSFVFVILYLVVASLYVANLGELPKGKIFISIHLLSFCLIIYCLLFACKALKTVEEKRFVELNECIADLVMLFIFPIGIWAIQPRVNKIFSSN